MWERTEMVFVEEVRPIFIHWGELRRWRRGDRSMDAVCVRLFLSISCLCIFVHQLWGSMFIYDVTCFSVHVRTCTGSLRWRRASVCCFYRLSCGACWTGFNMLPWRESERERGSNYPDSPAAHTHKTHRRKNKLQITLISLAHTHCLFFISFSQEIKSPRSD